MTMMRITSVRKVRRQPALADVTVRKPDGQPYTFRLNITERPVKRGADLDLVIGGMAT